MKILYLLRKTTTTVKKILPFRKSSRPDIADIAIPGSNDVAEKITQVEQEEYNAWCISPHVKPISDSEKKKKKSVVYWDKQKVYYLNNR